MAEKALGEEDDDDRSAESLNDNFMSPLQFSDQALVFLHIAEPEIYNLVSLLMLSPPIANTGQESSDDCLSFTVPRIQG
jgi:hypothetical protein